MGEILFGDLKALEMAGLRCTFDKDAQRYVTGRKSLRPAVMLNIGHARAIIAQYDGDGPDAQRGAT